MFSSKCVLEETFGQPGAPGSRLGPGLDIIPLTSSAVSPAQGGRVYPTVHLSLGGRLMSGGAAQARPLGFLL